MLVTQKHPNPQTPEKHFGPLGNKLIKLNDSIAEGLHITEHWIKGCESGLLYLDQFEQGMNIKKRKITFALDPTNSYHFAGGILDKLFMKANE